MNMPKLLEADGICVDASQIIAICGSESDSQTYITLAGGLSLQAPGDSADWIRRWKEAIPDHYEDLKCLDAALRADA